METYGSSRPLTTDQHEVTFENHQNANASRTIMVFAQSYVPILALLNMSIFLLTFSYPGPHCKMQIDSWSIQSEKNSFSFVGLSSMPHKSNECNWEERVAMMMMTKKSWFVLSSICSSEQKKFLSEPFPDSLHQRMAKRTLSRREWCHMDRESLSKTFPLIIMQLCDRKEINMSLPFPWRFRNVPWTDGWHEGFQLSIFQSEE